MEQLAQIYGRRFSDADAEKKDKLWREIARYLQRYVPEDAALLDIGCDHGDFIRNINAREKWATDLRDVSRHLTPDISFVRSDGLLLEDVMPHEHFDIAFMSNYLEHLPSSEAVIEQFRVVATLLKPGGRVLVLQPNIRLVRGAYWDFIDHKVALTEKSLAEAAELAGLEVDKVLTRFLPYTTKTRLPQAPIHVRAYVALRHVWFVCGKQTLSIAKKPA